MKIMESSTTPTIIIIIINTFVFLSCFFHNHLLVSAFSSSSKSTYAFPKEALPTKSGYLPVSTTSTSSLFYAFYEAQNSTLPLSQTPLLIWLQGGPGSSSMIGNFYEVGPWRVTKSLTLEPNPGAWNRIFGLLFLDNPIGVGFSVASSPQEIPTDPDGVAKHLFAAITMFFRLDPIFKHRPIYITGLSYGGRFAAATGHYILKENAKLRASQRVNLAGVVIGDGAIDSLTQMMTSAVNSYYLGLINERQKNELEKLQSEAFRLVEIEKWNEATNARNKVWRTLLDMTGLPSMLDYTRIDPNHYKDLIAQLLNIPEVKKALGANESHVFEVSSNIVRAIFHDDQMKSVKYMVEDLVRSSKVLLFQGQYDMAAGIAHVEAWVKTMRWEGIVEYLNAERKIWKVNGELAGYVQKWKSLTNVDVLRAGHILPADQPVNAQAMIEDWVLEKGLFGNGQQENVTPNSSSFSSL